MQKRIVTILINLCFIAVFLVRNLQFMFIDKTYFIVFIFPYLLSNSLVGIMLIRALFNKPREVNSSNCAFIISVVASNLPFAIGIISPLFSQNANINIAFTGAIINLCTLPFYVLAVLQLGKNLSVLPEATSLKTDGIYSFSRHPLYATYVIWYITQISICQTWKVVFISMLQILLQVIRANKEEEILQKNFPEYVSYKNQVSWFGRKYSRKFVHKKNL